MSKPDTTIGYYREKANYTQQKIADILGVPRTTMSFYETKREYPIMEVAEKIAELLEVPIGKLYSEEELNLMKAK
jgi:DNA-binding XRE family transcriptional regulator